MSEPDDEGSTGSDGSGVGLGITGGPRRYGGASADERKKQRRERLIEAGFEVFGRDGYLHTTMRLVCAHARLSERYFYESFESTDELYRAVNHRESSKMSERIFAVLASMQDKDGVEMTRAGLNAYFEYIQEDPRRAQILLTDAITMGMANPQQQGTRIAMYSDLVRDRLLHKYPEVRQDLIIDYVVAGFSGHIIQVASTWASRRFDTPIPILVEHVVYAWRGLHLWLSELAASKRAQPLLPDQSPSPSA